MAEMSHYTIHFIFPAKNTVYVCVFLFHSVCCDQQVERVNVSWLSSIQKEQIELERKN